MTNVAKLDHQGGKTAKRMLDSNQMNPLSVASAVQELEKIVAGLQQNFLRKLSCHPGQRFSAPFIPQDSFQAGVSWVSSGKLEQQFHNRLTNFELPP